MLLLIAGYGLAAIAFYAYIYLTAQPDPSECRSGLDNQCPEASLPLSVPAGAVNSSPGGERTPAHLSAPATAPGLRRY
ncbi:MAG: hypothetical protein K0Q72_308 [Armatimonadetes bacterium]|jgi:hypothetical protein|nr:hypothetical protein [Armatimonadota bacterium]